MHTITDSAQASLQTQGNATETIISYDISEDCCTLINATVLGKEVISGDVFSACYTKTLKKSGGSCVFVSSTEAAYYSAIDESLNDCIFGLQIDSSDGFKLLAKISGNENQAIDWNVQLQLRSLSIDEMPAEAS